jgi:hypothetical protein
MDNLNDEKYNSKKCLTNTITYIINKKMKTYNDKLETLKQKMDENLEVSLLIIKTLKEENNNLQNKFNEKIDLLMSNIKMLKNDNNHLEEKLKNILLVKEDNNIITIRKDENIKNKINKDKILKNESNDVLLNEENIGFNYKEIKRENYLLDNNFVKESLDMSNINGDIQIFKKIYIDNIPKEYYPIRHIKKKLQYWLNNTMNDDDSIGTYIKNTILKNIEECYLKVNNYDNYVDNIDQFLKNQEHISKLREEKYKDKFLSKIISIITI